MKREYKTPKAKMVDYCYDEQVTAKSGGNVSGYGDPNYTGRCQQKSPTSCTSFWDADIGCAESAWSLRRK